MSILAMHEGQAAAAAPDYIAPPKPEPKFNWAGVATALPYGVAEAGMQVLGSVADIGAGLAYYRDTPSKDMQAGVPAEAFRSDLGDALRDRGREFRPDPQTASTAENLIFGFARGASKIVAGAMVAGPLGVVAAGGEEAMTQSDELRRQGVGLEARNKAGLVQGAGLALAALPLVGATLKQTAALYVAGGPGGYMAQQALTREILRNAGQDQIAAQFDPFDPVGLAVASLIPAGFAAWGIRGQRMAAAAKAAEDFRTGPVPSEVSPVADAVRQAYSPEVVDAARVVFSTEQRAASNLGDATAHADAHEAALSKAEDQMARGEPVQVADVAPPESQPLARGTFFDEEFTTAADVLSAYERGDLVAHARVKDGTDFAYGIDPATGEFVKSTDGYGSMIEAHGDAPDLTFFGGIEDGPAHTWAKYFAKDGKPIEVVFVRKSDSMQKSLGMGRVRDATGKESSYELSPLADYENPLMASEPAFVELGDWYTNKSQDVVAVLDYDPLQEFGGAIDQLRAAISPEPARAAEPTQAASAAFALRTALKLADGTVVIGAPGQTHLHLFSRTNGVKAVDSGFVDPDGNWLTRDDAEAIAKVGQGPLDAATYKRVMDERSSSAAPGVPGARPAAAEAAGLTPGASAETAAAAARIDGIRAQHPDLMVQIDGMDAPMRMDDFLAAVKAEADELEADAPLMEVAAQCALLNGP